MDITVIGINKTNALDLMKDKSVYVIKKDYFHKDEFAMRPIAKADVNDLLSGDALIVKITK